MGPLQRVINELGGYSGEPIKIMEVCGTHTASIFKNGIRSMISPKISLISGPGCPVCVTPASYTDRLVEYALKEGHCVLTFGDMMKVTGSGLSLTEAKAHGGRAVMLYSPLAAIKMASGEPDTQFVFAAVGFETTAPVYALLIEEIIKNDIKNLKLLTSIKKIIPAVEYICENEAGIDAFLCPGHASVITGCGVYRQLADKYRKPFVVGGFDGEHILSALYEIVSQLQSGRFEMKNMYPSVVSEDGNTKAALLINKYFETSDDYWRGIGKIKASGLRLRQPYAGYDAGSAFSCNEERLPQGCRCADVILGRISPADCGLFKTVCTPFAAVGPCMVSAEGACGIWYKNSI